MTIRRNAPSTAVRRLLAACCCALTLAAGATTETEDAINKAPMPHEAAGTHGPMVKVHLASAKAYLQGQPDDATQLSMLRAEVDRCVSNHNASGTAAKPPRAWPDHVNSFRTDVYYAVNRSITYADGVIYSVDPRDCSLLEVRRHTADLHSSLGICDIDFIARTARGACDATGQAGAKPPAYLPAPAAMPGAPPLHSGEHKTILGLECEVMPDPFDPDGKICSSLGGSFSSINVNGDIIQSGLPLEMTSVVGVEMLATRAALDAMVNGAVFTPYLAGGFSIVNTRRRP